MKFTKPEVSIVKFEAKDIIATSIAACSVIGQFVEECEWE